MLCILDSMSRRFIRTYIEISDFCGLSCSFCPAPKGRRGEMGLELFDRVCSQVAPLTQSVTFHLLGDPLYLSNFPLYLQIAQNHSLNVEIVTSGVYLHRFDASLLLNSPIRQISISLSALEDVGMTLREKVVQNCFKLIDLHQNLKSQTYINLRMHGNKLNEKMIQRFIDRFEIENHLSIYNRIRLNYKVFLIVTKSFEWTRARDERNSDVVLKRCHGLISQIGILANGIVVPCCIDCDGGIALGDIKTQTLGEILQTQRVQKIIQGFKKGIAVEEQCKRCSYPAINEDKS